MGTWGACTQDRGEADPEGERGGEGLPGEECVQRSRAREHLEFKTMRDSMRLKAASRGEWGELKGRAAQGHRLVTRGSTGPHFRPRGHGRPRRATARYLG